MRSKTLAMNLENERTNFIKLFLMSLILILLLAAQSNFAQQKNTNQNVKLVSKEINYNADNITMKGYLVYDENKKGKRPGVLVVHEWWGLNDYARKRADMLAELGYTAFAVDMFGEGKVADHPQDAQKFAGETMKNFKGAKDRFDKALDVLKENETVDKNKIAAIGYCFGGGVVLNMARTGADLKGVVSFHGSLATENQAKKGDINSAILVCHGGADNFITPEQFNNFITEMEGAKADYTVVVYANALHSYTSPYADEAAKKFNMNVAYNEKADKQSWLDMQNFFDRIFNDDFKVRSMKEYK